MPINHPGPDLSSKGLPLTAMSWIVPTVDTPATDSHYNRREGGAGSRWLPFESNKGDQFRIPDLITGRGQ